MPTNEMGRSALARSEPPPLTSGEIEELESRCRAAKWQHLRADLCTPAELLRLLSSLKGSAGKGNTSAAGAAPRPSRPSAPLATYDADCGELIELAACLEADPAFNPQTNAVYVRALRNAAASICGLVHALSPKEPTDVD